MTRAEVVATIKKARDAMVSEGWDELAAELTEVIDAFATMELTAAQILASMPPKPGSRPRGRPRKEKA